MTLLFLLTSCGWFSSTPVTPGDGVGDAEDGMDGVSLCSSDDDCGDGNPCNGTETCMEGRCIDGEAPPDGTACTTVLGVDGACGEELCIPLTCGDSAVDAGEECDDGNDVRADGCDIDCLYSCHFNEDCDDSNDCTIDMCNAGSMGRLCQYGPRPGPCDDGLFCTTGDTCDDRGECTGTPDRCSDGLSCTEDRCDDNRDSCSNPVTGGYCLIGGSCRDDGEEDPGSQCRMCDSASDQAAWSLRPPGSSCDDGYDCTENSCDGSGSCSSAQNDSLCAGVGALCRPACFPTDPSGCGTPPAQLDLACDAPAGGEVMTTCHASLGGFAGQIPCLDCSGEAGVVLLDFTDFGDTMHICDLNGWTPLDAGCCDDIQSCTLTGCPQTCCTDLLDVCRQDIDNRYLIRMTRRRCNEEELRIEKSFDSRGVGGLRLCFELATDNGASQSGALVYISDSTHIEEQIFCLNGDVQPGIDRVLYTYCVDLPSWTANNGNFQVRFILHSDNWSSTDVYLDSISLKGWLSGCAPNIATAFSESFSGCPNPITDGWNDWVVSGTPNCPGNWNCPAPSLGPSVQAVDESWSMERIVDASGLDGEVTLCFALGDSSGGGSFTVELDANRGMGRQTAWEQGGNLGPDNQCRSVCVNLSDINPDVERNPDLWIHFSLSNSDAYTTRYYTLDDISVTGAVYCDGSAYSSLGSMTESGDGTYDFSVMNTAGTILDLDLLCSWDSPPEPIEDGTTIHF